jgi:uncharacterized radical SAM protein YgiQ
MNHPAYLPMTAEEMRRMGRDSLDVIIVTGDAYVDHPSFCAALVGRYCESLGCSVGIIAMPDVNNDAAFTALSRPKYFFGVTAGNVDSMLSLFTAQKKPRSDDPYAAGGLANVRPARATIAYCNVLRRLYKNVPIVIGGVEASLRRISHYDYWSDTVRRPLLLDAKADLLVYGMGERPLGEIITRCKKGEAVRDMHDVRGTVAALGKSESDPLEKEKSASLVMLPSFEEVKASKDSFLTMTKLFYEHQHRKLFQKAGTRAVLVNPPPKPLTGEEFDALYELPFTYTPHPSYALPIPAYEQIKDSITVVRGCFGGCNFCGLGAHQGKTIQSRSPDSVRREIIKRSKFPGWKGMVSDIGGPTANMYGLSCKRPESDADAHGAPCTRRSCLVPSVCGLLETNQSRFANLVRSVSGMEQVRHVYVNSGIRMDLALLYPDIISVVAKQATGGQLSVAPEHLSKKVLEAMHKPRETGWEQFEAIFQKESANAGKEQYLVPYFIAGHPGSTIEDAKELGQYLRKRNIRVRQVQEYIPIPMTVSCAMYYTGRDPFTGKDVAVSYKLSEMRKQKDLIMWWKNG